MQSQPPPAVVLVDDEKSYVDLLAQLLQDSLPYPVRTFTRPRDAIERLPSLNPGLIVTDYYMPGLNGVELIRQVQRLIPDLPCILITGHSMDLNDDELATLPNLKGLLAKPFSAETLGDLIRRYWAGSPSLADVANS